MKTGMFHFLFSPFSLKGDSREQVTLGRKTKIEDNKRIDPKERRDQE